MRIYRFAWDFSSTAEIATGLMLAVAVIAALFA
jgi:hypothetical protein